MHVLLNPFRLISSSTDESQVVVFLVVMADLQMPYSPTADGSQVVLSIDTIYGTPVSQGQLRLLHLEGFDGLGVLHCSFRPYELLDPQTPAYIATSYTWNPEERVWYGVYDTSPKPVTINGQIIQISDKVANIMSLMYQVDLFTLSHESNFADFVH